MNLRIALATTLLLAAPIARAQQPTPAPDAPKPDHQVREVRMDRGGPEGGPHGHSMRPEGRGEFWKNPEAVTRLGLSPDQVKKLDDISIKGKLEEIHLRAALEEDELMMKPLMEGAFDEKKAEAQVDKIAEAHASLEKARAKSMLSLRAVLTPDQWTKLHSHEGMDRHHGMGEGPGMGPRPGMGHQPEAHSMLHTPEVIPNDHPFGDSKPYETAEDHASLHPIPNSPMQQ